MTRRTFDHERDAERFVMAQPDTAEIMWEEPLGGPITVTVAV